MASNLEDDAKQQIAALKDQLRARDEFISKIFELAPIGVVCNDMADGRFVVTNPAFLEIIGRTPEELAALSRWEVTPQKYEADEADKIEQLKKTGKYGPYEKEYILRDGSTVFARLIGEVVKSPDGNETLLSFIETI